VAEPALLDDQEMERMTQIFLTYGANAQQR